jgi:non-specific serine/threonine protein kinase
MPTTGSTDPFRAQVLLGAGQMASTQGDYAVARAWLAESVARYRDLGDRRGLAEALLAAGFTARVQEDAADATRLLQEALTTARAVGHTFIEAASLHHLGLMAVDIRDDRPTARHLLEESLALYRRLELPRFVALLLLAMGDLARLRGDLREAHRLLQDSVEMMSRTGERLGIHGALDAFAELAIADRQVHRAVRLAGAAAGLRRRQGTQSWPVMARRREQWLARARTLLDDVTLGSLWQAGDAMSAEEAIDFALDEAGGE